MKSIYIYCFALLLAATSLAKSLCEASPEKGICRCCPKEEDTESKAEKKRKAELATRRETARCRAKKLVIPVLAQKAIDFESPPGAKARLAACDESLTLDALYITEFHRAGLHDVYEGLAASHLQSRSATQSDEQPRIFIGRNAAMKAKTVGEVIELVASRLDYEAFQKDCPKPATKGS